MPIELHVNPIERVELHKPTPHDIKLHVGVETIGNIPKYDGSYNVIPSEETQTLATSGKKMLNNVTVQPIPSNYGRIVWNGSVLKVY